MAASPPVDIRPAGPDRVTALAGVFGRAFVTEPVPIYEHLGFRVIREGDPSEGGPHMWFMRKDP